MTSEEDERDSSSLFTAASQSDINSFLHAQAAKIIGLNSCISDDIDGDDNNNSMNDASFPRITHISSSSGFNSHKKLIEPHLSRSCFASISNSSSQKQTISDDLTELKWLSTFKLKTFQDEKTNNNNNDANIKEQSYQQIINSNKNDKDQISKLSHELKIFDNEKQNINSISFGVIIFLAFYSKRYDKLTPWSLTMKQLYEYIQLNMKSKTNKRGWKSMLKQTLLTIPCFIKTKINMINSCCLWTVDPYYRPLLTRAYLTRSLLQLNR